MLVSLCKYHAINTKGVTPEAWDNGEEANQIDPNFSAMPAQNWEQFTIAMAYYAELHVYD